MKLGNPFVHNYKKLIILPTLLFIVFLFLIFIAPGVQQGIDFKGGNLIRIETQAEVDVAEVEALLNENFPLTGLSVTTTLNPRGYGLNIEYIENRAIAQAESELKLAQSLLEANPTDSSSHATNAINLVSGYAVPEKIPTEAEALLKVAKETVADAKQNFGKTLQQLIVDKFNLPENIAFQKKEVGAMLGKAFWETAVFVGIVAFVLVIIVVFIFFREVIPSFAIIAAAIFDISGALALMALFGVPLSLSSIPALLMLIGYSVDTDIMLTTRLLKRREKTPAERTYDGMKTGLTMTFTTLAAITIMLILSYLNQITVIFEIAAVLLFGLTADLISTWFMNAPVLLWYVERKKKKVGY